MKYHLTFFVIFCFFSISFSQQTKCECYSKSGVKDKTGIGGWTSIIGTNSEGKQLQYHFYAAYFPPQELCIPRDNYWWQEVNAAILKAVKSHPIYKSSQIALQTDDPDATPKATNIAGQAFITQQKVNEIKSLPGTVVSVDAYIQDRFASKLQLCSDIGDERNIDKKTESNSKNKTLDKTSNSKSKNTNSSGAKDFIDSQNEQFLKQQKLNQKLAEDLTQTFNKISDSWAKEKDFQSKISSITNIKSVNASSIINEARSKAQQINKAYTIRKQDALNQGVAATQNLVNSAQNEKQAIAGGILGAGLTALSQSSLEKERKKAQEKLENEKQQELKKLSQKIIDKFEPIAKQHKEAAIYAVKEENENYHLTQYEYAKCMIDNAYNIIIDNYSCRKPLISKPNTKPKKALFGQDYFDVYVRKNNSTSKDLKDNAFYFLELAIENEPNNVVWLYEKSSNKNLNVYEKAAILKEITDLDNKNLKWKTEYSDALKAIKIYEEKERLAILDFVQKMKVYGFKFENHNNLKRFNINGNTLFIDAYGKVEINLGNKYLFGEDLLFNFKDEYNEGLLRVQDLENKYGFLDTNGNIKIGSKYFDATEFSNGQAQVKESKNSEWKFIDIDGNEIIKSFSITHIVKKRDTLFSISKKYDISIKELKNINRINGRISVGQKLNIK